MSTDLPTEEDVLAELMAFWLIVHGPAYREGGYPDGTGAHDAVESLTDDRMTAFGWNGDDATDAEREQAILHAIADSERRLDCERARDAVVEAAREWGVRIFAGKRTNGDLLSAVCVLEAALMLCGAEVSRHGG